MAAGIGPVPVQDIDSDSLHVATAHDDRRNSSTLSLFSNLWSNNSSTVSLAQNRREPLDRPATADNTHGLNLSTASSFVPQFRHRTAKSTSSRVSLSSQPVIVRAYTAANRSRDSSMAPRVRATRKDAGLPPVESFSFDGILRAVESDIQEAIDGISEIYARSRLSMAHEHGAHKPPLGEITTSPRVRQSGLAIRTTGLERTLTTVAEASSSSERLAGESRAGSTTSGKGKLSAYGSLRSIMSKGKSPEGSPFAESSVSRRMLPPSWRLSDGRRPALMLKSHSSPSYHLSLDSIPITTTDTTLAEAIDTQSSSLPRVTNSSSWRPWARSRSATVISTQSHEPADAESALKDILTSKTTMISQSGG
ncbi:hypothetical protein EJ08DRAFT_691094 [Tothia fuscella]|uniref:Uncharacterized protein n=1 Tax=Tothia fuscella TaxID=1048955 RepID=A0A9P4P4V5_9PEZI|nr:hypothetical protein EJ08DRAFT_691094 [Tothia fuscella]